MKNAINDSRDVKSSDALFIPAKDRARYFLSDEYAKLCGTALVWVRDELASGRIESRNFDMNDWGWTEDTDDCGSARCIGGWTSHKLGYKIDGEEDRALFGSRKFRPLFFPHQLASWSAITPSQAVRAINNFLFNSPGDPQWAEVVKAPSLEQAAITSS